MLSSLIAMFGIYSMSWRSLSAFSWLITSSEKTIT